MLHDEIDALFSSTTKELPLPPPSSATEDSASSSETYNSETSSSCSSGEIPLSEYRERLLQRHKIYDPSISHSANGNSTPPPPPPPPPRSMYLPLNYTSYNTTPTTLKRIDQEEDTPTESIKTPTETKFHLAAHKSPFLPNDRPMSLPSPNLEGAVSSETGTIRLPSQSQWATEVSVLADEFSTQPILASPQDETFHRQIFTSQYSATHLENPFEYHLPEQEQQQEQEQKDTQPQSPHFLHSHSIKHSFKKFTNILKKSDSTSNLKKSTSVNTFKSSQFPDSQSQEYTYFTHSKVEDQQSTFTARTSTTSRTSPTTSPQLSLTPPPPVPPKSPQHSYSSKANSGSISTTGITASEFMASPDSPFWKYHILKFGKDLYLTTNPGMKHMYCRNAPGYFIEVVSNDPNHSEPTSSSGYSLIFKDSGSLNDSSEAPYMIITKKSLADGGYFTFTTPRENFLNQGTIMKFKDETSYNGVSYKEVIDKTYFPYDNLRAKYPSCFKNFELRDLHGVPWNIGSIPRVRASKVNRLKEKISTYYEGSYQGHTEEDFKFIGKKNIYFHQNFVPPDSQSIRFKEFEPKYIYGHDYGKSFPPVLSMFRPFESKIKKRVIRSVRNHSDPNNQYLEGQHDDYGTDTDKFYRESDGLYYVKNTADDVPDENKLGWVTIYEDNDVFGGIDNRGMFDLVIGMTLAVGYDSCLRD